MASIFFIVILEKEREGKSARKNIISRVQMRKTGEIIILATISDLERLSFKLQLLLELINQMLAMVKFHITSI